MNVTKEVYLWGNEDRTSFQAKADKQHARAQYSIHPYRDEDGARKARNTSKPRREKKLADPRARMK